MSPHLGPSLSLSLSFPPPTLPSLSLLLTLQLLEEPNILTLTWLLLSLVVQVVGRVGLVRLLPRLVVLYAWKEHNLIYMFILRELPQFVAFVGVSSSFVCLSHMSLPRGNPRPVLGFARLFLWASLAKSCRIVQVANFIVCPKALSRFLIGHSRG